MALAAKSEARAEALWNLEELAAGTGLGEEFYENVSFQVRPGEKIAFIGDQNSGRKLLLRNLCGLRPFRRGRMNVMGFECAPETERGDEWDTLLPRLVQAKIGVSLERAGLLSNVSVREGMELLFRFRYGDHNKKLRIGAQLLVQALCDRFEIANVAEKRPVELTKAERRLASLARAFLSKPRVVLLENPSDDIGAFHKKKLIKALDYIFESPERTVILSTDNLSLAWTYCERWIVFEEGKVVFDGAKENFFQTSHSLTEEGQPQSYR
jgi:ABC-type multidrug transport system ATPase subunit